MEANWDNLNRGTIAPQITSSPGDFFLSRSTTLTPPGGYSSSVNEPSVGSQGDGIFMTHNWYAEISTNNGSSFSYISPYTTFPNTPAAFSGGFCCDQRVAQDPSHDLIFWYLQYIESGGTNGVRIAVAHGQAGLATNTWQVHNFTPSDFGLGAGLWLDFPHLQVSSNYLYFTSNVFNTSDVFYGAVIGRIPLAALDSNTSFTMNTYVTTAFGSIAPVNGAKTIMYFGARNSSTSLKVIKWPESGSPTTSDVTGLSPLTFAAFNCPGPDMLNPCGRADTRMQTGWVTASEVGFMWHSAQNGGTRPYPYTRVAILNPSTLALISQPDIWGSTTAYLYPHLSVNARGHLAGVIDRLGGSSHPSVLGIIRDNYSPNVVTSGWELNTLASSNSGTSSRWGDYNGATFHEKYPNTWLAVGHTQIGGSADSSSKPMNFWFMRQRDNPANRAVMTTPAPGSTLGGTSATFNWSTGTLVTEYWLSVGTGAPGAYNIYEASTGTARSVLVTGLPNDGSTVYVRLWSFIDGSWQSIDYTYTAYTPVCAATAMTSPSPGSTLTGTTQTFSWVGNPCATQFWLYVGSAPGASNIYNASTGTNPSVVVSGLPNNGSTVYVRLFTYASGAWTSIDYTYTAWTLVCSATSMTSPAPYSTLAGTTQTFSWAGNPCATQFWLYVGTGTPGASNIFNASTGTTMSAAVSGLPKNGSTVYVRLFTYTGVWTSIDYEYTAFTAPIAALLSPANGSQLTGTSTVFAWTPGSGVAEYWLSVGTSQGGTTILSGTAGTALSKVVNSIPTATCSAAPSFTTPAAGSTLAGSSATFNWTNPCSGPTIWVRLWSRTGSVWDYNDYAMKTTGYNFRLGTTPGGSDLLTASQGLTPSSPLVTGLPTNGSIVYASLSYLSGGVWRPVSGSFLASGAVTGFSEDFNIPGPQPGWEAHSGDWIVDGASYVSHGLDGASSVSYNSIYESFDYTAVMKRDAPANGWANHLWIRGEPGPQTADSWWQNGYFFNYTSTGYFSVWKDVDGHEINVQPWTETAAIIQGPAWNTLRVVASGGSFAYWINGTIVWTGADPSLTAGRVGFGFYSPDWVRVDSAVLSTFVPEADQRLSPEQAALNQAALAAGSGGSINQAPPRKD